MKKFVRSLAIVLFTGSILFTGSLSAKENKAPYVVPPGEDVSFKVTLTHIPQTESVHLTIEKSGDKRLNVRLVGPDGQTLGNFLTQKKAGTTEVNYNFFGAQEGIYTLQVSRAGERVEKQIVLSRTKTKIVTDVAIK
ncbi:MAG: hypothetical protein J0H29_17545 [Sphingobacteriales bacterium]|nr:hypothetical protein [Sphingobacteriales bacterium]OJY84485.1 MAG: hypothetical protein BGP14_19825 [Sphingobacteriales bacterium 44-15]